MCDEPCAQDRTKGLDRQAVRVDSAAPVARQSGIAAGSVFAWVVIGAVAIALAAWIVLLVLIVWGRRDAPPYWDE